MNELKRIIAFHLILIPVAVVSVMDDAQHPERWGDWWCNPTYAIPYYIVLDAVVTGVLVKGWLDKRRKAKRRWFIDESIRLHEEGKFEAADAAYKEAMRLPS